MYRPSWCGHQLSGHMHRLLLEARVLDPTPPCLNGCRSRCQLSAEGHRSVLRLWSWPAYSLYMWATPWLFCHGNGLTSRGWQQISTLIHCTNPQQLLAPHPWSRLQELKLFIVFISVRKRFQPASVWNGPSVFQINDELAPCYSAYVALNDMIEATCEDVLQPYVSNSGTTISGLSVCALDLLQ